MPVLVLSPEDMSLLDVVIAAVGLVDKSDAFTVKMGTTGVGPAYPDASLTIVITSTAVA